MSDIRKENFQKAYFKQLENLIDNGYFTLIKENGGFVLKVSNQVLDCFRVDLEKTFYENVKYTKNKDMNFEESCKWIRDKMVEEAFGDRELIKNNKSIGESQAILKEYKNDFLNGEKIIFNISLPNASSRDEDIYSFNNMYRKKDIRTQMIVLNWVLPLINYFEENNYEIKEMFEDLKSIGGKNIFPAIESGSISGYQYLELILEKDLKAFNFNKLTLVDDKIVKIFSVDQKYSDTERIDGKYIINKQDDWDRLSTSARQFLNAMGPILKQAAEKKLTDLMKVYNADEEWALSEKTYDFARNKAHIFSILQKAFTLSFEELGEYRDSLLSDKKSMLVFKNASEFEMTKKYQFPFSKIVQKHLDELEIKEMALDLKKKNLGI